MAKIYLSATRLDFFAECRAIKSWLTGLGHEPVDSYAPDSQPVLESCLADIDGCDLYVLILGHRYGFRPLETNPENLSITHLEFRQAGIRDIPRIVLQSSSIPNVELSDIYDPVEMEAVKAFHIEVGGAVRSARFSSSEELIEKLRDGLSIELKKLDLSPTAVSLIEPLRRASRDLLAWPSTLPGGAWLERPELAVLRQRITDSPDSITLVLGEPGCGKSALLARLGQAVQAEGISVLAIKADFLPEDVLTPQALMQYLELPVPVFSAVQSLAEEGPVLVLVDQLDALADLVVQHSARLRVLLNLIRDLEGIANVHVVATCRSFEQRHDPGLRNLEAELLTMVLPSWGNVDAVLQAHGIQAGRWSEEMRGVLRSPHALATFLTLLGGTDELSLLRSYQGMLEILWNRTVLNDASGGRKKMMIDLALRMAEREMLWLPLSWFEERYSIVQELVAEGLLSMEEGAGRIGFRHQTLYEFVRARSFLDVEGSLTDTVLARQSSLRIRPQVWHALGYLRDVAPEIYQDELDRLWASELRPHLRILIIEFIGRQPTPMPGEIRLAMRNFDDAWFQQRFLITATGSPGWFAQLAQSHLPMLMARPVQEAAQVQPILSQAMDFSPQEVLVLVDNYWLPHRDRDELSWRVLVMGVLPPPDAAWVRRLETILSRSEWASWAVGEGAGIVSAVLPDDAPRLVAAWLTRQWREMQRDSQSAMLAPEGENEDDLLSTPRDRKLESLLICRDLHDLPVIAEAAPHAFIQALWPLFLEMLEFVTSEAHPFVVGYRDHQMLMDGLDDDEDSRSEYPLPEAITVAIKAWAGADLEAFMAFVRENAGLDLLHVQRWLARGLMKCVAHDPVFVLEFLCADPRRLVLGPYSDQHGDSRKLIEALVPHLDAARYQQMEDDIINWHRYCDVPDDGAETRRRRMHSNREHRLRLLRHLPKERMHPATRRLVDEEERAFPNLSERDIWFSGAHFIGSPVSAEQMQKGSDEDILHLFEELTDDHDWDHPRQSMQGGAIQAGRELARLAETDAERAVHLVRGLQPGRNETPVGEVLGKLVKAGYGREALYALIEELSAKGFAGSSFRHAAAHAVTEAVDKEHPVPESLLALLESWLVPVDPASEDVATNQEAHEREESLLWGHGGISWLPSGNYPALAALSAACLVAAPPRMERWLDILEGHLSRSESPRVWNAMAVPYLRWLNLAQPERAQAFLDGLFRAHPAVLGNKEGAHLMAYLQHWINPENAQCWLELMAQPGGKGAQGSGEVLMLRHALFPAEEWTRGQLATLLAATNEETRKQRVGITHAIVHLWSEAPHRNLAHGYLLPLLECGEEDVLRAAGRIFLSQTWYPDPPTRTLLAALCEHPALLRDQHANYLGEHLENLVEMEPERVAQLANVLLDQVGSQMGSIATSWYLTSEPLPSVALALQDMGEPHRTNGVALFERMLEFNLPQAHEMVLSLDKRTPQGAAAPSARRRKRARPKKT